MKTWSIFNTQHLSNRRCWSISSNTQRGAPNRNAPAMAPLPEALFVTAHSTNSPLPATTAGSSPSSLWNKQQQSQVPSSHNANKTPSSNNANPFRRYGILNARVLCHLPFRQYSIKTPSQCLLFKQYSIENPAQRSSRKTWRIQLGFCLNSDEPRSDQFSILNNLAGGSASRIHSVLKELEGYCYRILKESSETRSMSDS